MRPVNGAIILLGYQPINTIAFKDRQQLDKSSLHFIHTAVYFQYVFCEVSVALITQDLTYMDTEYAYKYIARDALVSDCCVDWLKK